MRLWSTRTSLVVVADTTPTPTEGPLMPISFEFVPSEQVDVTELDTGSARGTDALYVDGLARLYGHASGVVAIARNGQGVVVGVGLLSFADQHEALDADAPGLHHGLPPDACWTEAHYVLPEYRNKGVLAGLLEAERSYLHQRGFRLRYALIDSDNAASRRAFARAGYRPTGEIRRYSYRLNKLATEGSGIGDVARGRRA